MSGSSPVQTSPKPMRIDELLRILDARGVALIADGEELRVRAAKGALTPELTQQLKAQKPALLKLVRDLYRDPGSCLAAQVGSRWRPCRRMGTCRHPVDGRPCLVPATCCVCGAPLSHDRRTLCVACSGEFTSSRTQPPEGDQA